MAPSETGKLSNTSNPFAEAILSFIDELRDNEDRKSVFYKQVITVACRLYIAGNDAEEGLLSATGLSDYISNLQVQHQKKSGIRKTFTFLQPLVDGLMQYTSAVDVMVQADPTVSALIYGGAKLVLQLASEYTKYFEQITLMMEEIGIQLRCFHIYTREFATDKYLSDILCNSYRDILLFWRDASKILNQRGKRFFAAGLLVPFKERYGKFKSKLDRNAKSVERMTQALHIQAQGQFNKVQYLGIQDLTRAVELGGGRYSPRPPEYSDSDSGTQHDEIRRWISGGRVSRIDPKLDLERHLSSRHSGTAEWIFSDTIYSNWRLSGETASVWLNAAPGSGKSVLAASIVNNLHHSETTVENNVIYFFCRFDEPEKCKAISALRSLAIQALKLVKYIPDELYALYQDEYSAEDCYVANINIAEKALGYLLKRIDYISVVIDGLDECHETALLDSLVRLRDQKTHGITKWLCTSRNDSMIRKKFENSSWNILSVPSKIVQEDIRKFLEDNSDLLCGTSDQLDRITKISDGNFLMMRLTIDPFRNEELTCSEEFEEALETFQPELGRCWFRSLQRLLQRSEQIQELAQLVFTAVILAVQPMTFYELIDLLSVRIGEEPSVGRRRTRSVILSACSPFVEVDYDKDFVNPTLRLVHKSVGDFLTQDPATTTFVTEDCYKFFIKYQEGNADIGRRCLSYLSYNRYADFHDLSLTETADHGLLKYASIFWYKHVESAGKSRELYEMTRDFLRSSNMWTCIRVQAKYAPHTFARLFYDARTDFYKMSSTNKQISPDQEYYADALPSWLHEYNDDYDLVWGYHMLVREWGEVLVKYPDQIQHYFAKTFGNRGLWFVKEDGKFVVEVRILDNNVNLSGLPGLEDVEEMSTLKSQDLTDLSKKAQDESNHDSLKYISEITGEIRGKWEIQYKATARCERLAATVYRYGSQTSVKLNQDDSSDDDDSGEEEEAGSNGFQEPAIWFLSVTDSRGTTKWFHHLTKTAMVHKSVPIFVPSESWLLWPQNDSNILIINTNTWEIRKIKLIASKKETGRILVSQDYHFSSPRKLLHRASIHILEVNKCIVEHAIFDLSVSDPSLATVKSTPKLVSSNEAILARPTGALEPPVSFFWRDETLYAALGSPSVKLLRLVSSKPVQIYQTRLHIPSSSYSRQPRFFVTPFQKDNNLLRATFVLGCFLKAELPAVMLQFRLNEESWEEYDFEKYWKEERGMVMCNRFWKGSYATKEKAFSVPIRSGLNWRRSVYVTCW